MENTKTPQGNGNSSYPMVNGFQNIPIDLNELRLSQDFENSIKSVKLLTSIPVGKPDPQTFFRVHPDPIYRVETGVLEHRMDRETYLVDRSLWPELRSEIIPKVLYTVLTRQATLSIWAVRLPKSDGRLDNWNRSAHLAAEEAMKGWVRMVSNHDSNSYDVFVPQAHFPEPEWPSITFEEIIQIAFRDRYIRNIDHPVIKILQGRL